MQCIQRGRPSPSPSSSGRVSHLIFAVTPRPSDSAAPRSARTRLEPPMRLRKGDCRIPGTRRDGDVNKIRSEGAGRISTYYIWSVGGKRANGNRSQTHMLVYTLEFAIEALFDHGSSSLRNSTFFLIQNVLTRVLQ